MAQPRTLLPFLYPQLSPFTPRLLQRLLSKPTSCLSRPKSTLTPSQARAILATELPSLSDPSPTPPSPTEDHRTPPFLDTLTLTLLSGPGGNGCVSFLRDKFIPHGPPNGGDGGHGGDIYLSIDPQLTSLHKLARERVVKAGRGMNGLGASRNGRKGNDVVLKVPWGTTVRVLERGRGTKLPSQLAAEAEMDDYEGWEEVTPVQGSNSEQGGGSGGAENEVGGELIFKGVTKEEVGEIDYSKIRRRIPRRFAKSNVSDDSEWIHYPLSHAANLNSPHWPPRKPEGRGGAQPDVFRLDFEADGTGEAGTLESAAKRMEPILMLRGGEGGFGNPNFVTKENRRPMWATKGQKGAAMKIQLELKLLADVGLVGRPNVGKSSLLRCLTSSRARVGNWAFTTLKPNVGTVMLDDGSGVGDVLYGADGEARGRERFTVADIPGLVTDAGENKGLGWDFLRHVERARGLVFVVDLGFDPVRQVEGLWRDIKGYEKMREAERERIVQEERELREKERIEREDSVEEEGIVIKLSEEMEEPIEREKGIFEKPWMVVGNKADLEGAERRFMKLKEHLAKLEKERDMKAPIGCIAVSALKAGQWAEEEYSREQEVWKGVIGWFRSLVN